MKQTPVTQEQLTAWSENYNVSEKLQLATLALSKTDINAVTYVSKASFAMRQKFSIDIPTLDVTNQQSSGRCWLFAATNVLRERIAKALANERARMDALKAEHEDEADSDAQADADGADAEEA